MITQTKNIDVKILTRTESIDDKFTPLPHPCVISRAYIMESATPENGTFVALYILEGGTGRWLHTALTARLLETLAGAANGARHRFNDLDPSERPAPKGDAH